MIGGSLHHGSGLLKVMSGMNRGSPPKPLMLTIILQLHGHSGLLSDEFNRIHNCLSKSVTIVLNILWQHFVRR